MCHRPKKEPVLELPPSCRAAADKMEQALREEGADSVSPATITAPKKSEKEKAHVR